MKTNKAKFKNLSLHTQDEEELEKRNFEEFVCSRKQPAIVIPCIHRKTETWKTSEKLMEIIHFEEELLPGKRQNLQSWTRTLIL